MASVLAQQLCVFVYIVCMNCILLRQAVLESRSAKDVRMEVIYNILCHNCRRIQVLGMHGQCTASCWKVAIS